MIKRLWIFQIEKEEEKITPEVSKNEKGEEVTVNKKEIVKVPHKFFLRKPNRVLSDEASLFYGVLVNQLNKKGLPSRATLAKRLEKEGVGEDEIEKAEYLKLYAELFKKQEELQRNLLKEEKDRTEEDKKAIETLINEVGEIRLKFQKFTNKQETLFENTVENVAQSKTMVWWLLHLAYKDDEKLYFGDGSYDEKLVKLDEIEEGEDTFNKKVLERFYLGISFLTMGKAETQEQFDELLKSFDKDKI